MPPESLQVSSTNGKSVPILITWDVDPDLWIPFEQRQWAFQTAMNLCHDLNIRATFFITAEPAHLYSREVEMLQIQNHEIGCHGLTHGREEDYDRMPEDMQRTYIEKATEKLQTVSGLPIRSFRGPRVKTSATTLRLLAVNGYLADSSVCSQRVDFISSNLINPGWILSPRRPYRPHQDNAFKRGNIPVWEIPVSAAIIPFISSTLKVLGLSPMKSLFRLLYAEARQTGKPIVYLAHPTEFDRANRVQKSAPLGKRLAKYFTREYLSPRFIRTEGLRMRNLLYHMDGSTLLEKSYELFSYMASFTDVEFMTVKAYAASLEIAGLTGLSNDDTTTGTMGQKENKVPS
jgi:hypothetical protein